jgi:hypothetical protein
MFERSPELPAFHPCQENLTHALRSSELSCSAADRAYGPAFQRFSSLEADPRNACLTIVQKHCAQLTRLFARLSKSISAPLPALATLPNLKKDILARHAYANDVRHLLADHCKQFAAMRTKAERLRQAEGTRPPKLDEARIDIECAAHTHDALALLAREAEAVCCRDTRFYRNDFFSVVLQIVAAFAAARVEPCFAISAEGAKLTAAAAQIADVADSEIELLEATLAEMEAELSEGS